MTVTSFFPSPDHSIIVKDSIPIKILCKANGSDIYPGTSVETIQTAGSDEDRTDITLSTQYSKTHLGWVDYALDNRRTLGLNNANPDKDTEFADNDGVWVTLRAPVVESVLKAEQGTVLPGARLICGGSGTLQTHPDNLAPSTHTTGTNLTNTLTGYGLDPTVAIMLSRATTSASTQRIQVMPLW